MSAIETTRAAEKLLLVVPSRDGQVAAVASREIPAEIRPMITGTPVGGEDPAEPRAGQRRPAPRPPAPALPMAARRRSGPGPR